jgi:hypothetical protein
MNTQRVCHFYNTPQGCRKGSECTFLHTAKKSTPRHAPNNSNDPELSTSKWKHMVVHCKKSKYDVYIGRPNPSIEGSKSDEWGNPFKISDKMSRADVIDAYRNWINERPELIEKAKHELKGKTLACWCSPKACHGDVLAEIANE